MFLRVRTVTDGLELYNADCEPVRTTRARIIRLKNDYKELMSRIEQGLHEHHARLAEQAQNDSAAASQPQAGQSAPPAALEAPFAKVNSVVAGSPADDAGLRAGDTITKFGWVDWTNHERLGRVAEAVSQNEGVSSLGRRCWRHCSPIELPYARRGTRNMIKLTATQIPITVKALRPISSGGSAEAVQMQLTPRRNWGGRGLLGCHLLPL
jgi:26S proteasome non-ATPase regulatory subunit 9